MSKEGKTAKEAYKCEMKQQWNKPIIEEGFINLSIIFYFKDKRIRDIDNFNKLIFDAGTGIIWKDDSQIKPLFLDKYIDKDNPRVEIIIK
jgi:Holliday junction resolvase RusA-like endonuclease